MTRTKRLQPVVEHTDRKQQAALQVLAQSQAMLASEQKRLEQLQDYKLEYLQKKKHDIGVFTPLELQEFNRFMLQLDETIMRQMEVVEMRQKELEHKRQLWNASRIDSNKMHKVVEKLQQQEVAEQERREQKTMDELVRRKDTRR